ncbi:iron complex outermembrane recepter protein [Gillisia sp. Hel1_33_143]|uniref:TonB-dependent receptor domain-containing protein n=1 Tax=Gillisia sp. Hel1_33_143 TaxID=1336796 RepID=UPI00087D8D16|nr:TonB-dependent receptor [Gillisia sp. Hel1_33_143]SDR78382.1 iron complex outermembrane recepter protein [Gillisia sp. Hel1_33_143]
MKFIKIALLCALLPMSLKAQETYKKEQDSTRDPIELNTVILIGKGLLNPVLSMQKIDLPKKVVQPKNVADLFSDLNGFSLIKRGNYAIDPSFRASQYEQLNIQFDGGTKVMNACPNRMDPITTHVIPEEIERIEVIKGPYTVRFGATFGGIVNLVTQEPNTLTTGFHGSLSSGYETNGNALVSSLVLQQVSDTYDVKVNAGYRDFGNYEDGDGTEIPSAFRSLDYGLRLGYNIEENQRLQLNWRQSFGRDVLHAGLPMDTDEDNSSILSLDYKISNLTGFIKEMNAKVYYSYVDHIMSNNRRPSSMMTEALSTIDASTAGGKFELKMKPTENWILYGGLDALLIARDGGRTRLVKRNMMGDLLPQPVEFQDKIWQDSYVNDLGLFAESKYALSDKTMLTAGIRYDLVLSDIRDPEADFQEFYPNLEQRDEHNISATVSMKHALSENAAVELAYGRGVRSANMIERYINHFTVGQDPFEYFGNPFLKAEVNNQFELGLRGVENFENGIEALRYSISGYYSLYENYIVPVVDPSLNRKFMPTALPQEVKRFINLDKAYKTGFEAEAAIDFAQYFNFKTAVSYVYTKNKDLDESLPLTPPLTTRLGVGFERSKFWANLDYQVVSKQDEISSSFREQETAGYETLDVRFGLKPIKNLQLGLAVLNVFDATYNNHLNFSFANQADFGRVPINDPGRNFSAFIKYGF